MDAGKFKLIFYHKFRILQLLFLLSIISANNRYHTCPFCDTVSVEDTTERDNEKSKVLEKFGRVIIVRECLWKKSGFIGKESPYSKFYYDRKITKEKILEAVRDESFYGFLNITMSAPEHVRKKYEALNFPPLFKKVQPRKKDLSGKMQEFFDKEPSSQLSVGFEAEEMTLASNLVRFYLKEGFEVEDVHWALEYQRGLEVI